MFRCSLIVTSLCVALASAQLPLDDRPQLLERGPSTKEQEADQLLRQARTMFGVAIIRQRHEKLIEALTTLEKAKELDPESIEIRRTLVPLYSLLGCEEDARTLCQEIFKHDPHDFDIAFQYARLLKIANLPNEAIPVLQKAVALKAAKNRPERLLLLLNDLYELRSKKEDHREAAKTQEAIIQTINEHRESLLFGNGFTRDDLQHDLAVAHEALGRARVKTKEYAAAATAFRAARDLLLQSEDPSARHEAIRLRWNLSEMAAAQEKWTEALEALDGYLDHSPAELAPYEKKIEWLRKLGRDREVVPAMRRYADREQFHLGLQGLLARELAREPRTRAEAETMYLGLLLKHNKPELYRGLFQLYVLDKRMGEVLNMFDAAVTKSGGEGEEIASSEKESAQDRARTMLTVLRGEPTLVAALLPEAVAELGPTKKRSINTWTFLAALAARTKQLDKAEQFFRQCLTTLNPEQEFRVYAGLIEVMLYQKKHKEIASLCRDAIAGKLSTRNTNVVLFESHLASALAELGDYDAALPHANRAIELSSEDAKVRERCRKAHILAQAGRFEEAFAECEDLMTEFPQTHRVRQARYTLANAFSLKGQHAKSEEQLRLILESDPDAHLANNNLGYQFAERNVNLAEAEKLVRRAIEVDGRLRRDAGDEGANAAYLDSLGWVTFRQGKFDEARDWLEKAAALFDGAEDPTVWEHLGDTYIQLDLPAKAKEAWLTSLKLHEQSGKAKPDPRKREIEKRLRTLK